MLCERIYFRRDEITQPNKALNCSNCLYYRFDRKAGKLFESVSLEIKSKRTGKTSRILQVQAAEIEGISGIFYMSFSNNMIRKSEEVFDLWSGIKCTATPIGRTGVYGYVIYKLDFVR